MIEAQLISVDFAPKIAIDASVSLAPFSTISRGRSLLNRKYVVKVRLSTIWVQYTIIPISSSNSEEGWDTFPVILNSFETSDYDPNIFTTGIVELTQ